MNIYLLPPSNGDSNAVEDLAQRSGTKMISTEKLYEIIETEQTDGIVIFRLGTDNAITLMRNLSTLMRELPTVVLNAPGSAYAIDWMSALSTLPAIEWTELEAKMAKTGLLAQDTTSAEERSPATSQGHKSGRQTLNEMIETDKDLAEEIDANIRSIEEDQ